MLIVLPEIWIVVIDFVLWFLIHMSIAYTATIIPIKYINPKSWLFLKRDWEKEGDIYESVFNIKSWKELLPDGSALFKKGFKKKRMASLSSDYLERFILEACRAEAAHWFVILVSPVFFIWNYQWAGWVMIVYAIVANMPCILAQRYNRIRFKRILDKM